MQAWEAALAADVEHMPLTIHTVCGRLAVAAEILSFLAFYFYMFSQCYIPLCSINEKLSLNVIGVIW